MQSAPVFLFPGQGSQKVGMAKELYDAYPGVRHLFQQASDTLGKDLARLCFEGPDTELVRTDNAQPAITLANLASLHVLLEEGVTPVAAAGHSLGEYAALHAAGVLSFTDTMRLVDIRGKAMLAAADRHPGGMTAIFGLDRETLAGICEEAKDVGSIEVANHNSPTQVVLTGSKDALQKAAKLAKGAGAKLSVPLKVSGPWHSRFMAEAGKTMRETLAQCAISSPSFPVISNVTATPYPEEPAQIRERLVEQLVSPVQWVDSMTNLIGNGHKLYIEVGPGKVLSGLMRDINRESTVIGLQKPDDLEKVLVSLA